MESNNDKAILELTKDIDFLRIAIGMREDIKDSPLLNAFFSPVVGHALTSDALLVKKKELANKVYQREVLLEEKRVNHLAKELESYEQLAEKDKCDQCHESLPLSVNHYNKESTITTRFPCCGKLICLKCAEKVARRHNDPKDPFQLTHCFLCDAERMELTFERALFFAQQGHAWAQDHVGVHYETGQNVEKDMDEALFWYKKAAAQGYTRSEMTLGMHYNMRCERDSKITWQST